MCVPVFVCLCAYVSPSACMGQYLCVLVCLEICLYVDEGCVLVLVCACVFLYLCVEAFAYIICISCLYDLCLMCVGAYYF